MRVILVILFWIFCTTLSKSQAIPLDSYTVDTIHLGEFTAKKIVAYKYNDVTFYVKYEDYKKSFYVFWKRYSDGMKDARKEKLKGEYINPEYEPRWLLIDSVYQLLLKQARTQDTIFLYQKMFDKVGLGLFANFADLIEKKQCAITNEKNERQFIIIRQKGSWYKGPLAAWGGRRYFLPGATDFFIAATDWIS